MSQLPFHENFDDKEPVDPDALDIELIPVFGAAVFGVVHWQADLARALGMSPAMLSRIRSKDARRKRFPPEDLSGRLAKLILGRVSDAFALLDSAGMPKAGTPEMEKAQALVTEAIRLIS